VRSRVITFILAVLVIVAIVWFGQRALIYFPESDVPPPVAVGLPRAEPVMFETEDGLTLEGWFIPPEPPASGYTIIVFNGNAGHRGYRAALAGQLAARGVAVLLFDYRGYGGNAGLPSEEGLARDARAALGYAGRRPDVDRARLVFFGESLGTGVAVRLALEYPPAALILRSPFLSLVHLGQRHYPILPVRWMLRDRYSSIDRIARISSPLLVIAGEDDRIVPIDESRSLYEAAPQPKRLVVVPGADHNDEDLVHGPQVIRAVVDLLHGKTQ
jgi:fermentation-respiration switch protein FrsA (DUF1100 family)